MADNAKLTAAELEKISIDLVEKYAANIAKVLPDDRVTAVRIVRQNIRALIRTLARLDGTQNTSQFLELYALKYSATFFAAHADGASKPVRPSAVSHGDNVVQFSERFRNIKKAKP